MKKANKKHGRGVQTREVSLHGGQTLPVVDAVAVAVEQVQTVHHVHDVVDAPACDVSLSVRVGKPTQLLGDETGVDFGGVTLALLAHDEEDHLRCDELQGLLAASMSQE